MFLCKKCLEENFNNFAFTVSYGKCEYCGENKSCTDIPSKDLVLKNIKMPSISVIPKEGY